jgi:mono/diheme cytochrome c family protein
MTNPYPKPLPQPEGEEDAKRLVRVARLVLTLSLISIWQLASCESTNYVPPVTAKMASANLRRQDIDPSTHSTDAQGRPSLPPRRASTTSLAKLRQGRTLFVHRCIECHTLPALWHYTPKDWEQIVNDMAHRASLKPAERDAVIAYILAVRATER